MPRVFIPAQLRDLTAGQSEIEIAGAMVREIVGQLDRQFSGIAGRLCQEGELSPALQVSIDGTLSRWASVKAAIAIQRTGVKWQRTRLMLLPKTGCAIIYRNSSHDLNNSRLGCGHPDTSFRCPLRFGKGWQNACET